MLNTATLFGLSGLLVFMATTIVWFRRARSVSIPDDRTVFLLAWVAGGVLGLLSFFMAGAGVMSGIAGGLAVAGCVLLGTLYALGGQGVGDPVAVGDPAPAFEAMDDQGATYSSSALAGSPTLVKFFRGHW